MRRNILSEPVARNTAPACALAAFLLERTRPDAVLGVFPSDHVVANAKRFREVIEAGVELAASGEHIVVLGVPPTRAETGYGYIRARAQGSIRQWLRAAMCRRGGCSGLRRSPTASARRCSSHSEQLCVEQRDFSVEREDADWRRFASIARRWCRRWRRLPRRMERRSLSRCLPRCIRSATNISIDYAVLEPRSAKGEARSEIYCLPADFGWNDLGSWAALHEHKADCRRRTVAEECDRRRRPGSA